MSLPIPGLSRGPEMEPDLPEFGQDPMVFVATVVGDRTVAYMGQCLEYFVSPECPDQISIGDQVRVMFVPEVQEVFVQAVLS